MRKAAAILYTICIFFAVCFQIALALGVSWGEYAMGGINPGQFTPALRIAAFIQAGILVLFSLVVLSRAGIILPGWNKISKKAIWLVVTIGALSFFLNSITPDEKEKMIWSPFAFFLFLFSLIVALKKRQENLS